MLATQVVPGPGHAIRRNEDGSRTFIKRMRSAPDVRSHPNVEAEILAPLLFDAVGQPTLPVTPVFEVASRTWLVTMPFVEQADHDMGDGSHAYSEPLPTDLDTLALLALVDVLIGNADRQPRNVLKSADGRMLPIDHDVAFLAPDGSTRAVGLVGFVPGFSGVVASPADNGYRRWLLSRCGTIGHLLGSSPLYACFRRRTTSDRELRALRDASQFVVDRITDAYIDDALVKVHDAVIAGDPTARKREIRTILRARRDGLQDALRTYCARTNSCNREPDGSSVRDASNCNPQ